MHRHKQKKRKKEKKFVVETETHYSVCLTVSSLLCSVYTPLTCRCSQTPRHHCFSHHFMLVSGFFHTGVFPASVSASPHGNCGVSRFNTSVYPPSGGRTRNSEQTNIHTACIHLILFNLDLFGRWM